VDIDELKKLISEEIKKNIEFVLGEGPEDTQWDRKSGGDPRKTDTSKIALDPTIVNKRVDSEAEKPPPLPVKLISYNEFLEKFKEKEGETNLKAVIAIGILRYFNEKRTKSGKEEEEGEESLFADFKNSEFAHEHLQSLVAEEKENDE